MMKMHVDTAYRSLFKYGEELCGLMERLGKRVTKKYY